MSNRAVSRRHGTYADSWEEFLNGVARYSRSQRKAMNAEATTSGRLSVILGAESEWLAEYSMADAQKRLKNAQQRIAEERRLTADPAKFRPYVHDETRAMMPTLALHKVNHVEQKRNRQVCASFWAKVNNPSPTTVRRTLRDNQSAQRLAASPTGGPVSPDEINSFIKELRLLDQAIMSPEFRRTSGTRPTFNPAGMTQEKALEIAMRSLHTSNAHP